MKQSDILFQKRSKYYAFKENVNSVALGLDNIIEELEKPISKIVDGYVLNEEKADANKLEQLKNTIKEKRDLLKYQTLPAIDNKIERLGREIDTALEKELSEMV